MFVMTDAKAKEVVGAEQVTNAREVASKLCQGTKRKDLKEDLKKVEKEVKELENKDEVILALLYMLERRNPSNYRKRIGGTSRFTKEEVERMLNLIEKEGYTSKKVAELYGVHTSTIGAFKKAKREGKLKELNFKKK